MTEEPKKYSFNATLASKSAEDAKKKSESKVEGQGVLAKESDPAQKPFANLIQGAGPESGLTKEAEKLSEPSEPDFAGDVPAEDQAIAHINEAILFLKPVNSKSAVLAIGKLKGALEKLQG